MTNETKQNERQKHYEALEAYEKQDFVDINRYIGEGPFNRHVTFTAAGWARFCTIVAIAHTLHEMGTINPVTGKVVEVTDVTSMLMSNFRCDPGMKYFIADDGCLHSFSFALSRLVKAPEVKEMEKGKPDDMHYKDWLNQTFIAPQDYREWGGLDGWGYYQRVYVGGCIFHGENSLDILPRKGQKGPWSMHT